MGELSPTLGVVETPRSKPNTQEDPNHLKTRGERIVKDYTIATAPNSYRKERVEVRETAQMSFGIRNQPSEKPPTPTNQEKERGSSSFSSHKKAVPGAISSLDEIEIEFKNSNEEERGE